MTPRRSHLRGRALNTLWLNYMALDTKACAAPRRDVFQAVISAVKVVQHGRQYQEELISRPFSFIFVLNLFSYRGKKKKRNVEPIKIRNAKIIWNRYRLSQPN